MEKAALSQAHEILGTVRLLQQWIARAYCERMRGNGRKRMVELTLPQLNALHVVGMRRSVRMKELAELLQVSGPSATLMVDRLVEMGLLMRSQNPKDRRVVELRMSKQGEAAMREHHRHMETIILALMGRLGPECTEQWLDVYGRIREVLDDELRAEILRECKDEAKS